MTNATNQGQNIVMLPLQATQSAQFLATSMDGAIFTMTMVNNIIYVGGNFTKINGVTTGPLAQLSNSAWTGIAPTMTGEVHALYYDNSGNIYVGGNFNVPSGPSRAGVYNIAGATFAPIGAVCNGFVYGFIIQNQQLFVGGTFLTIDVKNGACTSPMNATSIAIYNLQTNQWSNTFKYNTNEFDGYDVRSFAILEDTGEVIVGGNFSSIANVILDSVGVWNGTGGVWHEVDFNTLPFTSQLEIYTVAYANQTYYVGGEFYHDVRFEQDAFQGAAYYRSNSWWGLNGGLKCSDCFITCYNCNITIPTIYTLNLLPAVYIVSSNLATTTTFSIGITNLLGTGGLFEEFGIPTNFIGSEIYFPNLTQPTNSSSLIDTFFQWQLWAIIFGIVFFISLILACIINACFRLCGCIKNIHDDSLSATEETGEE